MVERKHLDEATLRKEWAKAAGDDGVMTVDEFFAYVDADSKMGEYERNFVLAAVDDDTKGKKGKPDGKITVEEFLQFMIKGK